MSATRSVRRVITGHAKDGRSIIESDAVAHAVYHPQGNPNVALTDIWITDRAPAENDGEDPTKLPLKLLPPARGTVFRVLELPPDHLRDYSKTQDYFAGMDAGSGIRDPEAGRSLHPGMHKTSTVDYIVILSGEVWALVDEGEVLLRAGDCLVQRGTNHAWSNRSDKPCILAGVLVDALAVGSETH
jgi:hypothetical protein